MRGVLLFIGLIFAVFAYQDGWRVVHHNEQNNGNIYNQGLNTNGTCLEWIYEPADPSIRFTHTGVVSSDGDHLYIPTSNGQIHGRNVHDNAAEFIVNADHQSSIDACPGLGPDPSDTSVEILYYGTRDGYFGAIRPYDCKASAASCKLWEIKIECKDGSNVVECGVTGDIMVADEDPYYAYFGTTDKDTDKGRLWCYDSQGNLKWNKVVDTVIEGRNLPIDYAPALKGKNLFIGWGGSLYAFERTSGILLERADWSNRDPIASSVALSEVGDHIYAQTSSGRLLSFNASYAGDLLSTMDFEWACTYKDNGHSCCYNPLFCQYGDIPDIDVHSTPSLMNDGSYIYLVQYAASGTTQTGGVHKIRPDGSVVWRFNQLHGESIGSMRGSVTLDKDGDPYFLSQTAAKVRVWGFENDPYHAQMGEIKFMSEYEGLAMKNSVILTHDEKEEPRMIFSTHKMIYAFNEGYSCPSISTPDICSKHGACNCKTGVCSCDTCFVGEDCSVAKCGQGTCNYLTGACTCDKCHSGPNCEIPKCGLGSCNPATGQCTCAPCKTGENCTLDETCNGKGVCLPYGEPPGICQCTDVCASGDKCQDKQLCEGHGTCNTQTGCVCDRGYYGVDCSLDNEQYGLSGGATAAGVIMGLLIVGAFVVMYVLYSRKNPEGSYLPTDTDKEGLAAKQDYGSVTKGYGSQDL